MEDPTQVVFLEVNPEPVEQIDCESEFRGLRSDVKTQPPRWDTGELVVDFGPSGMLEPLVFLCLSQGAAESCCTEVPGEKTSPVSYRFPTEAYGGKYIQVVVSYVNPTAPIVSGLVDDGMCEEWHLSQHTFEIEPNGKWYGRVRFHLEDESA